MVLLGLVITSNQTQLLRAQASDFGYTVAAQVAESAKEPLLAGACARAGVEAVQTLIELGG